MRTVDPSSQQDYLLVVDASKPYASELGVYRDFEELAGYVLFWWETNNKQIYTEKKVIEGRFSEYKG